MVQNVARISDCNDEQSIDVPAPQILECGHQRIVEIFVQERISDQFVDVTLPHDVEETQVVEQSQIKEEIAERIQHVLQERVTMVRIKGVLAPLTTEEIGDAQREVTEPQCSEESFAVDWRQVALEVVQRLCDERVAF